MDEYQGPPPEGELITAALKRKRPKLTIREAARRAGISEAWWRQVVRGYQPLKGGGKAPMRGSAETIASMARVVGVTPDQLEAAERADAAAELRDLLAEPVDPMDEAEAILADSERIAADLRSLPPRERATATAAFTALVRSLKEQAESADGDASDRR